ncbi:uncharacterized protein LOC110425547 [Herrania umbratica]|uniref:Uncharacterized protein LOC110425547 n=1 Tax=Herrania umbratica TaxID=108875 RepID=A0A6J1B9K2_9ROSI|nr:uncharacterized protein LOC110425547 [Herrania umbratica]
MLHELQLSKELKNDLIWKKETYGKYTTKSFCKYTFDTINNTDGIWKFVWVNVAPHTVEMFVWQLLHGKIGVKEELIKRRVHLDNGVLSVLCNKKVESCDHLFAKCNETWKVWVRWCKMWGVSWISLGYVRGILELWNRYQLRSLDKRTWRMAFFVVVWSIWKDRNETILRGKEWDSGNCLELARIRVAEWANAKWPREFPSILDIYRQPTKQDQQTRR